MAAAIHDEMTVSDEEDDEEERDHDHSSFQEVEDDTESFLSLIQDPSHDVQLKREHCIRCRRPLPVCICSCLPVEEFPISTKVIILQHHSEVNRRLATVPILQKCISSDRLHVIRGKRFRPERYPILKKAIQSKLSVLLYPTSKAISIHSLPSHPIGKSDDSALIVLDGTWAQTKSIFSQNGFLHSINQVKLVSTTSSQYTIRTQPSKYSLSTLESVAHALAWLEGKPEIINVLVRPLSAMCDYQIQYGASVHYSKDHPQYIPRNESSKKLSHTLQEQESSEHSTEP